MLFFRIIRNDFARKRSSMIVVFAFIMLSSLLVSSGSRLIIELNNALDYLFSTARIPHFVQMHSGELDSEKLRRWSKANDMVAEQQIVEMISIDGSALFIGAGMESEENSIMDISFVSQNDAFDFLLDTENRIIRLSPGEIAVPIYYAEQKDVRIGDLVKVGNGEKEQIYEVSALVRDAQMNPAIVHSKRFLVADSDYRKIRQHFTEIEYLIEFRLTDAADLEEFTDAYLSAGMPQRGPTVDYRLFKTLNGLSDGIVAAVVVILSILLMLIAILCLRFTILAAIEEDYREIGVMKAVGMPQVSIKRIYLLKYITVGGTAVLSGYLSSLTTDRILMANCMRYIGRAPSGILTYIIPGVSAALIFLFILLSITLVLRRFRTISAITALQAGDTAEAPGKSGMLQVSRCGNMNIHLFLGMKDMADRFRIFSLLTFIFFLAAFITIIPVHFLATISDREFISYMGIGRSDIRIDLHRTEGMDARFEEMAAAIERDEDVVRYSPLVTSQFTLVADDGQTETLMVETGDFSIFPLDYLEGCEPQDDRDIALSYLNSRELNKDVGDLLSVISEGTQQDLRVCGIYQDITNGGRTAKASIPYNRRKVLWYTLGLNLKSGVPVSKKVHEYSGLFYPARVTDLETYLSQTLGNTIAQVRKITITAIVVGLSVAVLITSLFLRMLIGRDTGRVAIMRSLGFSLGQLRAQYLTTILVLLSIGIVTGTVFSNTAGQALIGFLISFMGAAQIQFIINPLLSSLLLPLLLIGTVSLTTVISITGIKEHTIAAAIAE
jgi:putative ABC transport system permease protein